MPMTLRDHAHAMQRHAYAVDAELRHRRNMGQAPIADCATLDASDPTPISAAIDSAMKLAKQSGRSGFAVLMDGDKAEVIPLGETKATVREATQGEAHAWGKSYEQMGSGAFERAKNESHEVERKAAGRFDPVHVEGAGHTQPPEKKTPPANDAESIRRKRMTQDARKWTQDQFARNAKVADSMREKAKQLWPNRSA